MKQSEEPTVAWTSEIAGFMVQRGIWLQAVVSSSSCCMYRIGSSSCEMYIDHDAL